MIIGKISKHTMFPLHCHSCLFNAVGYVLEGKTRTKAPQLRSLIASLVVGKLGAIVVFCKY